MPYSHGVWFEPEVPFVNLRLSTSTAHVSQLDGPPVPRKDPAAGRSRFPLVLSQGSALKRRSTISLLVVFKTIGLSEITLQRPMAEVENARRGGHEIVDCFPRSGGYRDRTGDIQLAKLALSQLS